MEPRGAFAVKVATLSEAKGCGGDVEDAKKVSQNGHMYDFHV